MNDEFTTPIVPDGSDGIPATPTRTKVKLNLICVSKCKRHTLEMAKMLRPSNKFTRVSEEFLISCEAALKSHIRSRVHGHPSKGKTLM
jgi:hypothetical protein